MSLIPRSKPAPVLDLETLSDEELQDARRRRTWRVFRGAQLVQLDRERLARKRALGVKPREVERWYRLRRLRLPEEPLAHWQFTEIDGATSRAAMAAAHVGEPETRVDPLRPAWTAKSLQSTLMRRSPIARR